MALDAIAIRALTDELSSAIINGRIDKIHQPEKDEILINIRAYSEHYKLVLSAASSNPRIHFTEHAKKNPSSPPMFCMLLRKHIGSGKIIDVHQEGFERIISIDIENYNELGDLTVKRLIIELMGRHSNIILVNDQNRIIDSIRHVDFTVSSVRQVLPGGIYELPPKQDRADFTNEAQLSMVQKGIKMDKLLMETYAGISPLTAREIVYEAYGRSDITVAEAEIIGIERIEKSAAEIRDQVLMGKFQPCMIKDGNRLIDFSAIKIEQYEGAAEVLKYDSVNKLLDEFYSGRDAVQRMKQKSADLVKLLNTNIDRASKKLIIQKKTLDDAKGKEKHKMSGDLIMSNLYRINQGDKETVLENFYDNSYPKIKIQLDPQLSPAQNAQRYYKKYQKAKNAEIEVTKQLEVSKNELEYLESTLNAVEQSENESDLNQIRAELAEEGYLKRRSQKSIQRQAAASKPMHFISSDGFDIYVGRNNTQNDYLTLKFANSQDIWFHTKQIHGSHTIIKLGVDKDIPKRTMKEAAQLAAYYSKARNSTQVPVDYTVIKNVKKPNGAKPGMVIYDKYNTVYVTPKGEI